MSTLQSPRRRLKFLYQNGFINRIPMPVVPGRGGSEAIYHLDKKGYEVIDPEGSIPKRFRKQDQVKPQFLAHALAVSEFRVNLEQSLQQRPHIELHRFVFDHELKSNMKGLPGRHRYRLFDTVRDPVTKAEIVVYPDAEIVLRGVGEFAGHQQLYFLEIDRGTEGLGIIQQKVAGYELYRRGGLYKKKGRFEDFIVLFQTTSAKRQQNMLKHISHVSGGGDVWITHESLVNQSDLLSTEIWRKTDDNLKSIMHLEKHP